MTVDRLLLARLLRENPFQPATGLWRAAEIRAVADRGLPVGRGLDIGSGDGRLIGILLDLLDHEGEIIGVDVEPSEVAAAQSTGNYTAVHLASADAIPEPNASFDWVFSNSTLEHIEPIAGTLAEVARVLRPGGTFIFTVPSDEFHACLRGPLIGSRRRYLAGVDERCAHLRYWNQQEWGNQLARVGLELRESDAYLTVRETRRWELISTLTAGVLHRLTRKHPMAIQRRLGMRRGQRMPEWLATLSARLLTLGLDRADNSKRYGCRYFVADRLGRTSD